MAIDINNLSDEEKEVIKDYDKHHKIGGKFAKFVSVGIGAVVGSVASLPFIIVGASAADALATNLTSNPIGAAISLGVCALGAVGVTAYSAYLGAKINNETNKDLEKIHARNNKLSPEALINFKLKTMDRIYAIREKAEIEEQEKRIQRSLDRTDTLIKIGGLGGFR